MGGGRCHKARRDPVWDGKRGVDERSDVLVPSGRVASLFGVDEVPQEQLRNPPSSMAPPHQSGWVPDRSKSCHYSYFLPFVF